jgi:hypothetical protein
MQELVAAQKRLEDLQAIRVGEAQKAWDFLGQAESTLAPFGFSPLQSRVPAQEVSAELLQLDSAGAKMLSWKMSPTGWRQRATSWRRRLRSTCCYARNQDPQVSLEPVVQGPAEQIPEAAQVDVREAAKVIAERFERQPEEA